MTVLFSHLKRLTVIFAMTVDTNHFTKLDNLFSCQAEVFQAGGGEPFPIIICNHYNQYLLIYTIFLEKAPLIFT